MIIGLTGLPRSGKDTVAKHIADHFHFQCLAFADPLKQAAVILLNRSIKDVNGIDYDREQIMPEWGFSMREFLQKFGTECLRDQIRQDFWVHHMRNRIKNFDDVVISDVRFENEVKMIQELGGSIWSIVRPGTRDNGHVSNKPMAYDVGIANDRGLEDLFRQVNVLMRMHKRP